MSADLLNMQKTILDDIIGNEEVIAVNQDPLGVQVCVSAFVNMCVCDGVFANMCVCDGVCLCVCVCVCDGGYVCV